MTDDERVEVVRRALDAWNAGELETLDDLSTPDAEFVPAVAGAVDDGPVRGFAAFRSFFTRVQQVWEEPPRIEPEEFRHVGGRVLLLGRIIARGRGSGVEVNQEIAALIDFEGEKIARVHNFLDPAEAIEFATKKEHA